MDSRFGDYGVGGQAGTSTAGGMFDTGGTAGQSGWEDGHGVNGRLKDSGGDDSSDEDCGVMQERGERRRLDSSSSSLNSLALHRLFTVFPEHFAGGAQCGDDALLAGGCCLDSGGCAVVGGCGSGAMGGVAILALTGKWVVSRPHQRWQQRLLLDAELAVTGVGKWQKILTSWWPAV